MKIKLLNILLLLAMSFTVFADDTRDSLLRLIAMQNDNVGKARLYNVLAKSENNPDTIIKYANLAIKYASDDKIIEAEAITYIAYVSYCAGDMNHSLELYRKAYDLCKDSGNNELIAKIVLNTGCCLDGLDDVAGALENYKLAIELTRQCGNISLTLWAYKQLCELCSEVKLFNLAEKYSKEAIELGRQSPDPAPSIIAYYSTADVIQWKTELLPPNEARKSQALKALALCDSVQMLVDRTKTTRTDYYTLLNQSYLTKCRIYLQFALSPTQPNKSCADSAQKYLSLAVKWFSETADSVELPAIHLYQANLLMFKRDYYGAIEECNKFTIKSYTDSYHKTYYYRILADAYTKLGQFAEAYQWGRKLYDIANLERQETKLAQIAERQINDRLDEFNLAETELKRQNYALATSVSDKQNKLFFTLIILALALIAIIITLVSVARKRRVNRLLEIKNQKLILQKTEIEQQQCVISEQKEKVERFNSLILQSIRYARHIQRTALSSDDDIKRLFPNSFLCYMPKDIVSGDFYYVTKCGDFNVFVIADCTGHGVPGGFLSMFGISAIKEILARPNPDVMPGKILDDMRTFIKEAFNGSDDDGYYDEQDASDDEEEETFSTADGMDMSVCAYNPTTRELRFAGAYHSAYLWSNGVITRLKGDRMPIGRHIKEDGQFNTITNILQQGDMLYMMTDGIQGQMGGLSGTKFMTKRLLQFFAENAMLPCPKQKECFESVMNDWMYHTIQVDDMTLVGIRVE